jgi:hypothetical protein
MTAVLEQFMLATAEMLAQYLEPALDWESAAAAVAVDKAFVLHALES